MSLQQKAIDFLKKIGLDVDKLVAAAKDDKEVEITLPDVEAFTKQELEARDAVKVSDGEKLAEPKIKKLLVSEIAKKVPGLDLKGERIGDLAAEIAAFTSKDTDAKVKTLSEQNQKLIADKTDLETQLTQKDAIVESKNLDTDLISHFPTGRGAGLNDVDRLTLLKSGLTFEKIDGVLVAKKDGVIIREGKTQAPAAIKDVVAAQFTERPILMGNVAVTGAAGGGGRGAGDQFGAAGAGGVLNTYSKAKEAWLAADPEKNVNTISPEFTEYVGKLAVEHKDFSWHT